MIVKVDLDPKLVWRLEAAAEKRGMSFNDFAAARLLMPESVSHGLVSVSRADETRRRVVALHADGLTDEEIAASVDRVKEHVARLRRGAGLKPNKGRGA